MIVAAKTAPDSQARTYAAKFETLLPRSQQHAKRAFRRCPCEEREEAVAEVVAHAWIVFLRLMDRGLEHVIYPTPLARYAIKRVRAHRCVGCVRNINDISSTYAQCQHGFHVDRLDQHDDLDGQWRQLLVEDRRAGPADTAAVRIDFADWLQQLPRRLRRIAAAAECCASSRPAAQTRTRDPPDANPISAASVPPVSSAWNSMPRCLKASGCRGLGVRRPLPPTVHSFF